jgi:hypothetical protein
MPRKMERGHTRNPGSEGLEQTGLVSRVTRLRLPTISGVWIARLVKNMSRSTGGGLWLANARFQITSQLGFPSLDPTQQSCGSKLQRQGFFQMFVVFFRIFGACSEVLYK